MTDEMISVVYSSFAARSVNAGQLREILNSARTNNRLLNVTGMLIYRDGHFLQILEGPASVVDKLLDKIRLDPRHLEMQIKSRKTIAQRRFSDWGMACLNISNGSAELIRQELQDEDDCDAQPQIIEALIEGLKTFKEYIKPSCPFLPVLARQADNPTCATSPIGSPS